MTIKQRDTVMKWLLSQRNEYNNIYKPRHFYRSFKGISPDEVDDCLEALEDDKYIRVARTDLEECDNIWGIEVLPAALSYFLKRKEEKRQIRRSWWQVLFGVLGGAILGVLGTLLVQYLTGAC